MSDSFDARLAVLEHRVNNIDMKLSAIDNKLESLLQLKSKGMGAFWLASLIFGTSVVSLVAVMVSWIKH